MTAPAKKATALSSACGRGGRRRVRRAAVCEQGASSVERPPPPPLFDPTPAHLRTHQVGLAHGLLAPALGEGLRQQSHRCCCRCYQVLLLPLLRLLEIEEDARCGWTAKGDLGRLLLTAGSLPGVPCSRAVSGASLCGLQSIHRLLQHCRDRACSLPARQCAQQPRSRRKPHAAALLPGAPCAYSRRSGWARAVSCI